VEENIDPIEEFSRLECKKFNIASIFGYFILPLGLKNLTLKKFILKRQKLRVKSGLCMVKILSKRIDMQTSSHMMIQGLKIWLQSKKKSSKYF